MNESINQTSPTFLTIKSGTSVSRFSTELVNKGWIKNRIWLRIYSRLYPPKVALKTGTFKIDANISLKALLSQLVEGKEHQFSITFIEGTTFKEWLVQLKNAPQLIQTFNNLSISKIADRLSIKNSNPEGWFFPDTYSYTAGTKDIELLSRSHKVMAEYLDGLWSKRAKELPYKDAYQALTMASIIEKESGFSGELSLISSVFINRLNKRMRLQTDPTVIYGLGERYKGDIKRSHLQEKTPYNTYRINGLPPTPIAMPGLAALTASFHPQKSPYLYFVSNADGAHVFSSNLTDHNRAVRLYLAKMKTKHK